MAISQLYNQIYISHLLLFLNVTQFDDANSICVSIMCFFLRSPYMARITCFCMILNLFVCPSHLIGLFHL